MNYYEHHIGDYAEATAHLSFAEDAAYSRLIRKYYSTEKPLPAEIVAVQRIVGARTREEKKAVESVLREFFFLTHDGWRNNRCDSEIERFRSKQDKARASANARWQHAERNANAMRTHSEGNALQTPDTRHQTEDKGEARKRATPPKRPEDVTEQTWTDWIALRKAKRAPVTTTVIEDATCEAQKAGMTLEAFLREWCSRGSQGLRAEWLDRRPAAAQSLDAKRTATIAGLTGRTGGQHGNGAASVVEVAARVVA